MGAVSRGVPEFLPMPRNSSPNPHRDTECRGKPAAAWKRARRPKQCGLARNPMLRELVAGKLAMEWSLEQISARLKLAFADDETLRVSQETIYRCLYVQARSVLKKDLAWRAAVTEALSASWFELQTTVAS